MRGGGSEMGAGTVINKQHKTKITQHETKTRQQGLVLAVTEVFMF